MATETSKFENFLNANPEDPRVVRILKLLDGGPALNSKAGRLIGELMRDIA